MAKVPDKPRRTDETIGAFSFPKGVSSLLDTVSSQKAM
jgi:hypothetical protein